MDLRFLYVYKKKYKIRLSKQQTTEDFYHIKDILCLLYTGHISNIDDLDANALLSKKYPKILLRRENLNARKKYKVELIYFKNSL